MQVLLKARADPKVANEEGQFPVDLAATNGYTEIAQELEKQIVFAVRVNNVVVMTTVYIHVYRYHKTFLS